jgi:uncharacterized protein (DUF697 family)/tellurite resistance protein
MNPAETRSLLTIALMAAFADGMKDERERERVSELAKRLPVEGIDLPALHHQVASGTLSLAEVAKPLAGNRPLALLAYEMAVGVADADGVHTPAEGAFLDQLAAALDLPRATAKEIVQDADAIAAASAIPASAAGTRATAPAAPAAAAVDSAALDKRILDASITNAALELLPESLSTMAILPLQARLVYNVGKAYGYELDQGHVKEFAATLGVGLTGQYLEQIGRRLLGGVLGGVLGGMGRSIGRQAASSGMAFATTWALGQVAKQYYAGGRTLDADKLKAAFQPLLSQGKDMIATYAPQIEERARSIDLKKLPQLIGRV